MVEGWRRGARKDQKREQGVLRTQRERDEGPLYECVLLSNGHRNPCKGDKQVMAAIRHCQSKGMESEAET